MDERLTDLGRAVPASSLLGYLNFSDGRPDPRFQKSLNDAYAFLARHGDAAPWLTLPGWLREQCAALEAGGSAAFRDLGQARAVVGLVFDRLLPAYRRHHADLLAHQPDAALFAPFFLARAGEAVLAQGGPWDEADRVVAGALNKLNDFVGHRPAAVLETRPQTELYPHERVRPVPLYLRGAGVGYGPYEPLISRALEVLRTTEPDLLADAGFDPEVLDELALDPRAYDHGHPVNRRPNYLFGEWDPHHIDNQGRYRRFVLRQATLDALLGRATDPDLLFEAAAVLAGTILMAAGICGSGPAAHDSATTLSTLVPRIARFRDAFYNRLIAGVGGAHGDRLREEATRLRQPFGGARQHVNQELARQRATQLQERWLSLLFAEMGFADASRDRAGRIPTTSVRILSEIRLRHTAARLAADRGRTADAAALLPEVEDLLTRGIECGALVDPWNVLGFQGLFPLFQSREDSARDPRVEELLDVVSRHLDLYARLLAAAAGAGDPGLRKTLERGLNQFAAWWDRFATADVGDLPRVHGGERADAARHVAEALARWQARPEGGNDLAFWRQHRDGFRTPAAFAQVVEALLRLGDGRAAMALLMTWLSQADEVPLDAAPASFHPLADRWLHDALADRPAEVVRFFELLEANADEFWRVPGLGDGPRREADDEDESDDGDVYDAAYDEVTYRDSTDDGEEGSVVGDGPPGGEFALEADAPHLEQRLKFLATVARLWQAAARAWVGLPEGAAGPMAAWLGVARRHQRELLGLLDALAEVKVPEPVGQFDALVEYDRRRVVKDQLIDAAVQTCLEFARAVRGLTAGLRRAEELPGPGGTPDDAPAWESLAVRLTQALGRPDPEGVRRLLPAFVRAFEKEPLLVVPLSEGGHPRGTLRARLAQTFLQTLLEQLPRLGLLRETFALVKLSRAMEQNSSGPGRKVTEFDRLFRTAVQAVAESILASAARWRPEERGPELAFVELLRRVADSFLALWLAHSQTLRLSALESVGGASEWAELRKFVKAYGTERFTPQFLAAANLRGILHRGTRAYLEGLRDDPDATGKLAEDLQAGRLDLKKAAGHLEAVAQAVLENYEEFRDYNTTAAQSDYGENLHVLLDFLRLKASYDRYAWRMKPLALVHEVLCRRGADPAAARWQENLASFTRRLADELLEELNRLEREAGLRLRTVRDHLEERFLHPLVLDRLCALVAPAMREAAEQEGRAGPAFARLEQQIAPLAANPTGVGLDVPHWLRRLDAEVQRVRTGPPAGTSDEGRVFLAFADLQRQLNEWEKPIG